MDEQKQTNEIPEVKLSSNNIEYLHSILEIFSPRDIQKALQEVFFQSLMGTNDSHIGSENINQVFYMLINLFQQIEEEEIKDATTVRLGLGW